MSFVMFAIVGLFVGVIFYAMARNTFHLVLPLALLMGVAVAFVGGVVGNLIAGHYLGEIRPASVGGMGIAGIAGIGLMGFLGHRRHLRQQAIEDERIFRMTTTFR